MSSFAGPTGRVSGVKGTGYNQVSLPTMSPEQMGLFNQLLKGTQSGLSGGAGGGGGLDFLSKLAGGGDSQMWGQLEAPALRQFGELQGQLASRFSGMGSGARRSSGFHNATSGAAADLAERLQSQRMGFQRDAIAQLLGLSESLLGRNTQDTMFMPKKKPWWQELLSGVGDVTGQAAGTFGGLGLSKWAGII